MARILMEMTFLCLFLVYIDINSQNLDGKDINVHRTYVSANIFFTLKIIVCWEIYVTVYETYLGLC